MDIGARTSILVIAAAVTVAAPTATSAQIRASEKASVSQTVDGTTLSLEYYRPVAKGRELFGGIVPWGVVWTPGANWATTLEISSDARINGVDVAAGKYSVWVIPHPDRFTISLNENPEIFHFHKPDSASARYNIAATPEKGAHAELLTWAFTNVRGDAARLEMKWGETTIPLQVLVEPSRPLALTAEERALYVGHYEMSMTPGLGWPEGGTFEVFEQDGHLKGRMPFGIHPEDDLAFDLIPAGEGRFNPGLHRGGKLFGVEMGVNIEFALGTDVASAVRWYGPMGTPFGSGDRVEAVEQR
jgi:hypothetical protein